MDRKEFSRRRFIETASTGSLGAIALGSIPFIGTSSNTTSKLAILGGQPVRSKKSWVQWPVVNDEMIKSIEETTRSGIWCRIQSKTGTVETFEKAFADLM